MARLSVLEQCKRIPLAKATEPPTKSGTYNLIVGHYWQVVDDCLLLFRGFAPQCNANESITKRLAGDTGDVQYIERVWLHHECDQ